MEPAGTRIVYLDLVVAVDDCHCGDLLAAGVAWESIYSKNTSVKSFRTT
jgi:hypothetical protein